MNEQNKTYIFWVGSIRYSGNIISQTETHWVVNEIKEGEIYIPKTAVMKEVGK